MHPRANLCLSPLIKAITSASTPFSTRSGLVRTQMIRCPSGSTSCARSSISSVAISTFADTTASITDLGFSIYRCTNGIDHLYILLACDARCRSFEDSRNIDHAEMLFFRPAHLQEQDIVGESSGKLISYIHNIVSLL
jgi:hypothetical protein